MATIIGALYHIFGRRKAEDRPTKPNLPDINIEAENGKVFKRPGLSLRYVFVYMLSIMFSGAMIAIIILTLKSNNGWPQPYWAEDTISLHAFISWLAALGKLALLIPLAEAMGQMKWRLFAGKERRKLSDMDLMDSAGRDVFGALGWIFRFRGGIFVHIGAVLVIASFGFEGSLQQMLNYEIRDRKSGIDQRAHIQANHAYTPQRGLEGGLVYATPQVMLNGVYASLFNEDAAAVSVKYSCPTGKCSFPEVSTVGICSSCTDISSTLKRTCRDLTEKNPYKPGASKRNWLTNGQMCSYTSTATNITAGGGKTFLAVTGTGAEFTKKGDGTMQIPADLSSISTVFLQPNEDNKTPGYLPSSDSEHTAKAYTCALSYCALLSRSKIENGVLTEEHTPDPNQLKEYTLKSLNDLSELNDSLLRQTMDLTSNPSSAKISTAAAYALSAGFSLSMTGNSTKLPALKPEPGSISELHRALYQKLTKDDFPTIMKRMTDAMTAAIRNEGDLKHRGDVWESAIYVRVTWWWIALPAALWLGTLVMLLCALRRGHVWWGTSALPLLFLGLEAQVKDDSSRLFATWRDRKGMQEVGEKWRVRVHENEGRREMTRLNVGEERLYYGI